MLASIFRDLPIQNAELILLPFSINPLSSAPAKNAFKTLPFNIIQ